MELGKKAMAERRKKVWLENSAIGIPKADVTPLKSSGVFEASFFFCSFFQFNSFLIRFAIVWFFRERKENFYSFSFSFSDYDVGGHFAQCFIPSFIFTCGILKFQIFYFFFSTDFVIVEHVVNIIQSSCMNYTNHTYMTSMLAQHFCGPYIQFEYKK